MFNRRNVIMKLNHTIPALAIGLLGWACSAVDTGSAGTSIESEGIVANTPVKDWSVSGVSQKGPFVTGSVVTVQELDGITLKQTGKSFKGSIKSDKGDFSINGLNLVSQYAMLEATGYFWNETCGCKSMGTVTLRAITDLSDRNKVNINLFTHLEFDRVMYLVTEEGKTVAEAKAQAESEILAAFGIDVQLANPEDLNIFESGDGNAALLAVSVLMQGYADGADLSERMGDFSTALAAEGSWDNPKTKAAMADWASEADVYGMFPDLLNNLKEWGNDEIPDFIKYVRNFWYDVYGLGACTESREGEVAADSNKQSAFYYKKTDLRYVCERGRWKKAETLKSDVDGFGEGAEGDSIVDAKTSMGYVWQTWFGANGSDSIYHSFSENPSRWYVVEDSEIDSGNTTVDWPVAVDTSNAGWLKSVIDTCKGICGDVTFGDGFGSPYVDIGFSLVQDTSWDAESGGYNVESFGGVCIAYSSTVDMTVLMVVPRDVSPDFGFARFELPHSDTVRVERIPWSSFAEPSWAQPVDSYEKSVQEMTALRVELSGDAGTTGSFNIKAFGPYDGDCDKYADFE